MAAAHERPAGMWHAEWLALPQLFGLAAGAMREARVLAEGLVVHPARMRENLEATRGLLFADAAAARLAPHLGRAAAHDIVERAAEQVRDTGRDLRSVLEDDGGLRAKAPGLSLAEAFDIAPSVAAAALWVDRAVADAERVRASILPRAAGEGDHANHGGGDTCAHPP
jgi:3-carboxy-cis,cis-muconate cycloisomerase